MTRVYYREAVGAFVVFDCTRPRTFDSVRLQSIVWRRVMLRRVSSFCAAFGSAKICMLQVTKWKQDIDQKVLDSSGKPVPVVLLMERARTPLITLLLLLHLTPNSFPCRATAT